MEFASTETTNLLLVVLTLFVMAQFALLVAVVLAMRAAAARARFAYVELTGGDPRLLRDRCDRLLSDIETLVAHGNTLLGAVERGAKDFGTAAAAVSGTAQRAMAAGSFKATAVTMAIRTGLRWLFARKAGGWQ